jgi:nucleotide-binding universal stress UspA family protein
VPWLVFAVVWVACGAATVVLMARRGHDIATWTVLGLLFGPVAPVFALQAVGEEREGRPRVVRHGAGGSGTVDLVAGVDGSPESIAALRSAVALLDGGLGRTVVAVVEPYDADEDRGRDCLLAAAAKAIEPVEPAEVRLRGEPATALCRYAVEEGFQLIVVGARGHGRSSSPLGSVARRLASGSPVPVLIGPTTRT